MTSYSALAKCSYNCIASSKICPHHSKNLITGKKYSLIQLRIKKLIHSLWVQILESCVSCQICSVAALKTVFWDRLCSPAPWSTEEQKAQWVKVIITLLYKQACPTCRMLPALYALSYSKPVPSQATGAYL